MSGFMIGAALVFLLSFIGCVAYLWYDQQPAVQARRELRFLVHDAEDATQEVRTLTEATKAAMNQIATEWKRL